MKITFTKRYTKYAVGDSATFPATEGKALIGLGLAVEVKDEAPAPKKGEKAAASVSRSLPRQTFIRNKLTVSKLGICRATCTRHFRTLKFRPPLWKRSHK